MVCLVLVGYFYAMVYLGVYQNNVNDIRRAPALFNEKLKKKNCQSHYLDCEFGNDRHHSVITTCELTREKVEALEDVELG